MRPLTNGTMALLPLLWNDCGSRRMIHSLLLELTELAK